MFMIIKEKFNEVMSLFKTESQYRCVSNESNEYNMKKINEICKWCKINFNEYESWNFNPDGSIFYFKEKEQELLFKLTWLGET